MNNNYIKALILKYEAEIAEAEANLELYLNEANLSAIGEHSNLMHEHDIWIDKLTSASDKLETLKRFLNTKNESI